MIPDKNWREEINAFERDCRKRKGHLVRRASVFTAGAKGCGRSDLRDFNLGDNASLAIGQGDVLATPLQVAVAYAALENGGKVVRPHLGLDIESAGAELIQRIERDPSRKIALDASYLQTVRNGLHLAASTPDGTSGDVFAGWDQARYPSTARPARPSSRRPSRTSRGTSPTCPTRDRPIVVAVTVEEGGFGAAVAAPIACRMLAKYYAQDGSKCAAGAATAR